MNTTTPSSATNNYSSTKASSRKSSMNASTDLEKNGIQSVFESLDADETLAQLKGYVKTAADFAKKRPVLVLSVACAIGAIGLWAWTTQKSTSDASI